MKQNQSKGLEFGVVAVASLVHLVTSKIYWYVVIGKTIVSSVRMSI